MTRVAAAAVAVVALGAGQGCYSAYLTPQGRMISDMRVSELGGRILIDLPEARSETVRQRLADFVFSEEVEVRDVRAVGHEPVLRVDVTGDAATRVVGAAR